MVTTLCVTFTESVPKVQFEASPDPLTKASDPTETDLPAPIAAEAIVPEPLIPRVSSLKKPDGSITSKPLEDLFPFLSREEFLENMIVDPVEILKK